MANPCRFFVAAIFLLALSASRADAWGGKEHVQLTRIAVQRLIDDPTTPPAMKDWLKTLVPQPMDMQGEHEFMLRGRVGTDIHNAGGGVLTWVMMPDDRAFNDPKENKRQPFNQSERLMHFIDLELFLTGDQKREYRDDLSAKPPAQNVPRDHTDKRYQQAGYLPFAAEQAYQELVRCIREKKLSTDVPALGRGAGPTPTTPEGLAAEDSAVKWAGYLAHYVQDNTQPHHSTIDYKSTTYFADKRKAPNVHAEMEWRLVDDAKHDYPEMREELWQLFSARLADVKDPVQTNDVWDATLQTALTAYDALPLIGRAAAAARIPAGEGEKSDSIDMQKFMHFRAQVAGQDVSVMEVKARQMALAVLRTQKLFRQAWREATGE